MPETEEFKKDFDFNIPIEKSYRDDSGSPHVVAIASDTREDKEGDKLSRECLEDMARQIRESDDIEFKDHHESAFGFGRAVDARVQTIEEDGYERDILEVDFKLKEDWPQSQELYENVNSGDCDKQLSIGGEIDASNPGSYSFQFNAGSRRKVVNRVNLDHIVACPSGYAANEGTQFVDAIIKTLDKATGEGSEDQENKNVFEFDKETFLNYENGLFFQSENPYLLELVQNISNEFTNRNGVMIFPTKYEGNHYLAEIIADGENRSEEEFKDAIYLYPLRNIDIENEEEIKDNVINEINETINSVNKNEKEEDINKTTDDNMEDEEYQDVGDTPEWKEGQKVRWQVEPDLKGRVVHVDEDRKVLMVEIMEMDEGELSPTGFTITAGYTDVIPMESDAMLEASHGNEGECGEGMVWDAEAGECVPEGSMNLMNTVDFESFAKDEENKEWSFDDNEDGNFLLVHGSKADNMSEFDELSEEEKHEGWKMYKKAHAFYNSDGGDSDEFSDAPHNKNAYGLPHHKLVDGEMRTNLSGVISATSKINGANGGFEKADSLDELESAFNHLAKHYEEFNREPPSFDPPNAEEMDRKETENSDEEENESLEDEEIDNKLNDFVPNNPDDYEEVESDEWDGHDYEDFRPALADAIDDYDSLEDVPEFFVDLPISQKQWVASRYAIVVGDEITEETEFGDIKLEHHRINGDVDRAGVIAARQRLPNTDASEDALEEADIHLTNHLRNDFNEEEAEPIMSNEDAEIDPRIADVEAEDYDYQSAMKGLKIFSDFGQTVMDTITQDEGSEESDEQEEEIVAREEVVEDINSLSDLQETLDEYELNEKEEEILEERLGADLIEGGDDEVERSESEEQDNSKEEGDESSMDADKLGEMIENLQETVDSVADRVSDLEAEESEEESDEAIDVEPDSLEDQETDDIDEGDELEDSDVEENEELEDEVADDDEVEDNVEDDDDQLEDQETDQEEDELEDEEPSSNQDESVNEKIEESFDQFKDKIDQLADSVESISGRVKNLENRTGPRQGLDETDVSKTKDGDEDNVFEGVVFG